MKKTPLKRGNSKLKYKPLKKRSKGIKKTRQSTIKKKEKTSKERQTYFEHHLKICTVSIESGKSINNPTRANICHIFDKSRHKSLQSNLENCIYLTLSEHERFDHLLYSHKFEVIEKEFPNSWGFTCRKLLYLLPLVEENTVFTRAVKKYLDERFKSN